MAYVTYLDNRKPSNPTPEQAFLIWKIKTGRQAPDTKDQANFVKQVKAVYLNYRHAPAEYVEANLDWIAPLALGDWFVDAYGTPVKPSSEQSWQFARKYGLWTHGRMSQRVKDLL